MLSSVDIGLKISSSYSGVGAPMRAGKLPALEYFCRQSRYCTFNMREVEPVLELDVACTTTL